MFNKKYSTPNSLQLALIVSVGASYIMGFLQLLTAAAQAGQGQHYVPALIGQAFPALLLGIAFFLNPRPKLTQTQRMFEAIIITIAGVAALAALSQFAGYVMGLGANLDYNHLIGYEFGAMIVLLGVIAGGLWFLGRTKRWK
jgi:hypothetical protein